MGQQETPHHRNLDQAEVSGAQCFRKPVKREAPVERELYRESGPGGVGRRL